MWSCPPRSDPTTPPPRPASPTKKRCPQPCGRGNSSRFRQFAGYAWKRLLHLAVQDTLGGLSFYAIHQQPIILGEPGQLFALCSAPQAVYKFRTALGQHYLILIHKILHMLGCPVPHAPGRGRVDLHLTVTNGMVERRIAAVVP